MDLSPIWSNIGDSLDASIVSVTLLLRPPKVLILTSPDWAVSGTLQTIRVFVHSLISVLSVPPGNSTLESSYLIHPKFFPSMVMNSPVAAV